MEEMELKAQIWKLSKINNSRREKVAEMRHYTYVVSCTRYADSRIALVSELAALYRGSHSTLDLTLQCTTCCTGLALHCTSLYTVPYSTIYLTMFCTSFHTVPPATGPHFTLDPTLHCTPLYLYLTLHCTTLCSVPRSILDLSLHCTSLYTVLHFTLYYTL